MKTLTHTCLTLALSLTHVQYAIEAAEAGDFSEVAALMDVCRRPYDEQPDVDAKYSSKPPPEMVRPGVCVLSCSS